MNTPRILLVAIAAIALPACASRATLPSAEAPEALDAASLDAAAVTDAASNEARRCGELLPMIDGSAGWTVEGFGGPDAQVFVTRRQPRIACGSSAGGHGARLDALR